MLVETPLKSDSADKREQASNVSEARSHRNWHGWGASLKHTPLICWPVNPKEETNFPLLHFQI